MKYGQKFLFFIKVKRNTSRWLRQLFVDSILNSILDNVMRILSLPPIVFVHPLGTQVTVSKKSSGTVTNCCLELSQLKQLNWFPQIKTSLLNKSIEEETRDSFCFKRRKWPPLSFSGIHVKLPSDHRTQFPSCIQLNWTLIFSCCVRNQFDWIDSWDEVRFICDKMNSMPVVTIEVINDIKQVLQDAFTGSNSIHTLV